MVKSDQSLRLIRRLTKGRIGKSIYKDNLCVCACVSLCSPYKILGQDVYANVLVLDSKENTVYIFERL